MVQFALAPTLSDILTTLRSFLLGALPLGIDVQRGQANRVPEPKAANFIIMTPTRQVRLRTNIDGDADCLFTASIAGTSMTVTGIVIGSLSPGSLLFGTGLVGGTATLL